MGIMEKLNGMAENLEDTKSQSVAQEKIQQIRNKTLSELSIKELNFAAEYYRVRATNADNEGKATYYFVQCITYQNELLNRKK